MVSNYGHWLTDFKTVFVLALFRDNPLATIGHPWPDGQMAINGHFGHFWPFMSEEMMIYMSTFW